MALSEEQKREIDNYLSDREKFKEEVTEDIKASLYNHFSSPDRNLSANEIKLIKNATKGYNVTTLIVTLLTAVSITAIATIYTQNLKDQYQVELSKNLLDYEKYKEQFKDDLDSIVDVNEKNIERLAERVRAFNDTLLADIQKDGQDLSKKMTEFEVYNRLYAQNIRTLESSKNELDEELLALKDKLTASEKLKNDVEARAAELLETLDQSAELSNILKNSQSQLLVKSEGTENYMEVGQLFFQWGTGNTGTQGLGNIQLIGKVNSPEDYSIAVMGDNLKYNSFATIEGASKLGAGIRLWNSYGKKDYYQKNAPYRYLVVGKVSAKE